MISRGSSIHHTRRTNNPFMTTSSGIVGIDLREKAVFDAPKLQSSCNTNQADGQTTSTLTDFMYQTTSGTLGEGVWTKERLRLSQRMDKLTLRKEVEASGLATVRHVNVTAPEDCAIRPEAIMPKSIDIKTITQAQTQHPLYNTSYRDIGAEKAQLKVDVERFGRPNTFTNSFNGFRYRDFGLNTAVTKSRVCDELDFS